MADELVLVTGGSGFIGAHCIFCACWRRATVCTATLVRDLKRAGHVFTRHA